MSKGWNERRAPPGASLMSTAAMCRTAWRRVHIEDRGLQLGDAIYEVCRIADGGRLLDEEEHLDRLERSLARNRDGDADEPRGAQIRHARDWSQRNAVRDGLALSAGHARGRAARPSNTARGAKADADRHRARHRYRRHRTGGMRRASRSSRAPDERWGRCDIKIDPAPGQSCSPKPTPAGQAPLRHG